MSSSCSLIFLIIITSSILCVKGRIYHFQPEQVHISFGGKLRFALGVEKLLVIVYTLIIPR